MTDKLVQSRINPHRPGCNVVCKYLYDGYTLLCKNMTRTLNLAPVIRLQSTIYCIIFQCSVIILSDT